MKGDPELICDCLRLFSRHRVFGQRLPDCRKDCGRQE